MQHQKAQHFKCNMCPRRLNIAGGLAFHTQQVHKHELTMVGAHSSLPQSSATTSHLSSPMFGTILQNSPKIERIHEYDHQEWTGCSEQHRSATPYASSGCEMSTKLHQKVCSSPLTFTTVMLTMNYFSSHVRLHIV
jgi:hypothetical protein